MTAAEAPALAVIIPCTRPRMARLCLEGLAAQPQSACIEVFVVGDTDGISPPPGLRVVFVPYVPLHTNRRRDAALRRITAPLVAFLDDDTVPQPGWLDAALLVDPGGSTVMTGPEHAFADHPTARLIEEVASSILAEGSLCHRIERRREVGWTDVPFSNAVLPAHLITDVGGLGLDIPSDIDDLEFMLRCRSRADFVNEPRLVVLHDRYPTTVRGLLRYRWRVRRRVGEKLVTHPGLYWRIPPAALLAVAPAAGIGLLATVGVRRGLRATIAGYTLLLATQAVVGTRRVGIRRAPAFVGVTAALHATNLAAVQVGLLKGLTGSAASGTYDARVPAPHSVHPRTLTDAGPP